MNEKMTLHELFVRLEGQQVEIAQAEDQIRKLQDLRQRLSHEILSKRADLDKVNAVIQYLQNKYKV